MFYRGMERNIESVNRFIKALSSFTVHSSKSIQHLTYKCKEAEAVREAAVREPPPDSRKQFLVLNKQWPAWGWKVTSCKENKYDSRHLLLACSASLLQPNKTTRSCIAYSHGSGHKAASSPEVRSNSLWLIQPLQWHECNTKKPPHISSPNSLHFQDLRPSITIQKSCEFGYSIKSFPCSPDRIYEIWIRKDSQ